MKVAFRECRHHVTIHLFYCSTKVWLKFTSFRYHFPSWSHSSNTIVEILLDNGFARRHLTECLSCIIKVDQGFAEGWDIFSAASRMQRLDSDLDLDVWESGTIWVPLCIHHDCLTLTPGFSRRLFHRRSINFSPTSACCRLCGEDDDSNSNLSLSLYRLYLHRLSLSLELV
jgi:hypothetical protein